MFEPLRPHVRNLAGDGGSEDGAEKGQHASAAGAFSSVTGLGATEHLHAMVWRCAGTLLSCLIEVTTPQQGKSNQTRRRRRRLFRRVQGTVRLCTLAVPTPTPLTSLVLSQALPSWLSDEAIGYQRTATSVIATAAKVARCLRCTRLFGVRSGLPVLRSPWPLTVRQRGLCTPCRWRTRGIGLKNKSVQLLAYSREYWGEHA